MEGCIFVAVAHPSPGVGGGMGAAPCLSGAAIQALVSPGAAAWIPDAPAGSREGQLRFAHVFSPFKAAHHPCPDLQQEVGEQEVVGPCCSSPGPQGWLQGKKSPLVVPSTS